MASVTITSSALSPSTKTVVCSQVLVGMKRDVVTNPNANPTYLSYAQTQGVENPTYVLQGVMFTGGSGVLTYADLLTLLKLNYSGSNAPTLSVVYGTSTSLVGYDGSTTAIPVVVKDFTFPIDVRDSRNGYLPSLNINLVETR